MKKVFVKHLFSKEADLRKHTKLKNLLILAYRKGETLFFQNFESYPKEAVKIEFDPKSGFLSIKCKLSDSEFLALGDEDGVATKLEVKK